MKQFRCGDVVPGCQWVTRSADESELLEDIHSHAREAHGMDEVPPALADEVVARMEDVSEAAPPGRAA